MNANMRVTTFAEGGSLGQGCHYYVKYEPILGWVVALVLSARTTT